MVQVVKANESRPRAGGVNGGKEFELEFGLELETTVALLPFARRVESSQVSSDGDDRHVRRVEEMTGRQSSLGVGSDVRRKGSKPDTARRGVERGVDPALSPTVHSGQCGAKAGLLLQPCMFRTDDNMDIQ